MNFVYRSDYELYVILTETLRTSTIYQSINHFICP